MKIDDFFLVNRYRFYDFKGSEQSIVIWSAERNRLVGISGTMFNLLASRNFNGEKSLQEMFQPVAEKKPHDKKNGLIYRYSINLQTLGCSILLRCKYKKCFIDFSRFLSNFITAAFCSPDVIIDCDWENFHKSFYVHRSANKSGEPLKGLKVHHSASISANDWSFAAPPFPPIELYPLKDQFVGLHAAMVRTGNEKGLLILGPSGTGKTSSSIELCNNFGCSLLSDDLSYIRKRSLLAEPFCIPIGLRKNGLPKKGIIPASEACRNISDRPVLISHIVVLERWENHETKIEEIGAYETLHILLAHHQDVGCNMDESIVTLLNIASSAKACKLSFPHYDALIKACPDLLGFSKK